jgi:hypothetical protein
MSYKFNPFTGTLDDVGTGGGGTTSPAGSNTEIQYNNSGSFGASADLTWDDTAKELGVGGDINLDDGGTYETTVQVVTPTANRTISFPDATGTVALVAGSNQAVQYNSAGTNAGDSGLLYDATSGSLTVGGKTVTTDAPVINLSQTWNSAGTTFTGLKLNVTNTASASGSNLLDLQVGGTSVSSVLSDGKVIAGDGDGSTVGGFRFASQPNVGMFLQTTNIGGGSYILSFRDISNNVTFSLSGGFARLSHNYALGWATGASNASNVDLALARDAANTLAQRNGTNAQTYRLYNTYTDASNYERTSITRDSSGLVIDAQKGGTGADPTNLLDVKLDGASTFSVSSTNGNITTNAQRINLVSNTTAQAHIYAGTGGAGNAIDLAGTGGALNTVALRVGYAGLTIRQSIPIGWASGTTINTGLDVALARDSAGVVKITDGSTGTGYIKQVPVAVSALPAAATVGAGTRGFVNDANATTFASVVAGGGANVVPVYSDGTDWRIG